MSTITKNIVLNNTSAEAVEISQEELLSLTTAVYKRYGIDFTNYETKSLTRGFGRIISKHKFKSLIDLWSIIMKDRQFLYSCIDDLTVNLTEFYRNASLWLWLKENLVKEFDKYESIKVWHAACSSGEEAYSFSFLLHHLGYKNYSLHGTDLSESCIEKAKKGIYTSVFANKYKRALSEVFEDVQFSDMFIDQGNNFQIQSEIMKPVKFSLSNLLEPTQQNDNNIVFCRNVMIYFDERLKIRILEKLHGSLKKGGKLIIGYYDSLPKGMEHLFTPLSSEYKVYIKTD